MDSETAKAQDAKPEEITIFHKIISKDIPSDCVYEDDVVYAFRDINPAAPTHIVIIPKKLDGLTGLSEAEERHIDTLGRLMFAASKIAKQEGLEDGYRVVVNNGKHGGQSVYYIHLHLFGGKQFTWPPGTSK